LDLIVDTPGSSVRRHRQRIVLTVDGEKREFAVEDVEQLVVAPASRSAAMSCGWPQSRGPTL
jgi:hypothetical protein